MARKKKKGSSFIIFLLVCIIVALSGKIVYETALEFLYPKKYTEYVEYYAEEYGIDETLVYAVIRTESGFDPEAVSFPQLLDIFLSSVDPFDPDGQFIDRGHSYTLAVYYCCDAQRKSAEAAVQALAEEAAQPVYVSIEPFKSFYRAEEEHQDYYRKHPEEFKQELIDSGRIKS